MDLTIIIPAYNEGKRIRHTLEDYLSHPWKYSVKILVVLNGCKDNTLNIVKELARKYRNLKYIELLEGNKGKALVEGFKKAESDLIGFTDADECTKPKEFERLVDLLNSYDGVIGSRWAKGAKILSKQTLMRRIASRGFNILVRIILGLNFKDTQCGLKVFRKKVIKSVIKDIMTLGWAVDICILYPIKKRGYKIREVGTEWKEPGGGSLKMWKTVPKMFYAILKLRFKKWA